MHTCPFFRSRIHFILSSDDDESDVKPSPAKKPRVAGGAARQKSMDKELLRDDAVFGGAVSAEQCAD